MKFHFLVSIVVLTVLSSCGSTSTVGKADVRQSGKTSLSEEQRRSFLFTFYEGLRLKEEGLYQQALDSLRKSYQIDSVDAGLLAEIALMEAFTDKKEEPVRTMQKALALEPDNWWFNTQMIRLYLNNNRKAEALALAEELQRKNPLKEEVYSLLIPMYQQSERYQDALNMYDKLEKIIGLNERVSFDKMSMNLMLNQPKKATAEIDKLIQKFPFENRYRVLKGDFLMQLRQPEKALALYEQVLTEEPQNPYVLISLSEYYNVMGDAARSLEYVVLALKNNQLEIETKIEILGQHIENLIKAEGKLEETESLFKLMIEYYPLDERVHEYYAAYLQHQKRDDDAVGVYESILAINPRKESIWFSLMQIFFGKKEYSKAIEIADRAIAALDNDLRAYYFKAISYDLAGETEKALNTHKEGLALFKENELPQLRSDFHSHLAELYNQLKDKENAYLAYEEAIRYNPENVMAMNNYAYNLSLDKSDLAKAERLSAKTIEKEPRNSTYLDTYAWIFYQQGNFSLAKFYMERAISYLTAEQNPGVYYEHYGDILWMTRTNDDKAIENWKKAWDAGVRSDELKQKIENRGWKRD
jgi:tetratricopeptide (TPR) repeat protein